jgi:hypothetical protein
MRAPDFLTRTFAVKAGALALCSVVLFLAGAFVGYGKGFAGGLYADGADAFYTVLALQAIRDGRTDQATKLLETKLDSQIVTLGTCEDGWRSMFNLLQWTSGGDEHDEAVSRLTAAVAEYRRRHPSQADDEGVREAVRSTLEKPGPEAEADDPSAHGERERRKGNER